MEVLLTLIILAVWVGISVLVYQHAEDNGHTGIAWAAVTFLFGFFGLGLYGIVHLLTRNAES